MAVDIKNLNHNQLNDLISKAQVRQQELRKEKVAKLREKIHALIKAEGYSFDDIFGSTRGGKTRRTGTTVAPKYRNPADPEQVWSGRGKRPRWFNDALKAGKKEKDLAI
ncbi:H-NS histone family protein [Dyella sp. C11]|uniref:H-NS histone family protein n=1 Tax=Dyella sp. C11 TaxID=2126991 RepID=UPI000D65C0D6|nr:H-NS histone family protein [Dyella sp. C11]